MRRSHRLNSMLALTLAACGGGAKHASAPTASAARECPEAGALRVAFHGPADAEGRPRWMLAEAIVPDDQDTLFPGDAAGEPGERALTPDDARRFGARSGQGPLWTFFDDGSPPCRATGGDWLALRGGDGRYYTQIVRVVEGCPAPKEAYHAFVVEAASVGTCAFEPAVGVAFTPTDAVGPTPPPADLASVFPTEACERPACVREWRVIGAAGHYDLLLSDIHPVDGEMDCNWVVDDLHGHFAVVAGQPRPIEFDQRGILLGAFVDAGGARLVISSEPGSFFVVAAGAAAAQGTLELAWAIPHEEDFGGMYSLGPYCGP